MPRIPFKQADIDVNLGRISPQAAGAPFAEVSRAGERMTQLAQYSAKAMDYIQKAQDNNEFAKLKIALDGETSKFARDMSLRTDHVNYDKHFTDTFDRLKNKYDGIIKDNPRLQERFNIYFAEQFVKYSDIVLAKKVTDIAKESNYLANADKDSFTQRYANAGTDEGREKVLEEFDKAMEERIQSGLDRKVAYEYRQGIERDGQRAEIVNALNSENVGRMKEVMGDLDKGRYNQLKQEEREIFKGKLDSSVKKIEQEQKKKEEEMIVDNAFGYLKGLLDRDYDTMLMLTTNLEFMKEYGLNAERAKKVGDLIKADQTRYESVFRGLKEEELKKIQRGISDKTLKVEDIRNAKYLDPTEKYTWEERLIKSLKRTDDDIDVFKEAEDYININKLIDIGVNPNVIRDSITISEMKSATKQKLFDRLDREIDTAVKNGVKSGNKILQTQIAPTRGEQEEHIPEEQKALMDAQVALSEWVNLQTGLAAGGKRKPLTEKEIYNQALSMIPHYKIPITDKLRIKWEREKGIIKEKLELIQKSPLELGKGKAEAPKKEGKPTQPVTAINPETGERIQWIDGEWKPIK